MDVDNVVMLYLVTISDATNEILPGDNTDLLNYIELNFLPQCGNIHDCLSSSIFEKHMACS